MVVEPFMQHLTEYLQVPQVIFFQVKKKSLLTLLENISSHVLDVLNTSENTTVYCIFSIYIVTLKAYLCFP